LLLVSLILDKLGGDALVGLFAVAVAHALVVAVMISAAHISGGHLNPAVTLGLLAGGHITIFRSLLYWIDQLVAAAAASYLLYYLSGGQVKISFLLIILNNKIYNIFQIKFTLKQLLVRTSISRFLYMKEYLVRNIVP